MLALTLHGCQLFLTRRTHLLEYRYGVVLTVQFAVSDMALLNTPTDVANLCMETTATTFRAMSDVSEMSQGLEAHEEDSPVVSRLLRSQRHFREMSGLIVVAVVV